MRLGVVLLALVLAGCAAGSPGPVDSESPSAPPPPPALLPGEDWVLLHAQADPATPRFTVTLRFEDGRASGKAPVNRYFGQVQAGADGTMTFGPVASTEMAGPPPAMRAETAYFAALPQVTGWEVADDLLTLKGTSGPLLVFAAPDSTGAFAVTLLGRTRAEAKAAAQAAGYTFRVVSVDGQPRAVTMDYRPDRIDATIVKGVVTEVSVG